MKPSMVLTAGAFVIAGCATQRPVLYPNDQLRRVGSAAAERDAGDCMRQAEAYVGSGGRGADAASSAAIGGVSGAAVGGAAGAAGGAILGRAASGGAAGAAGGAAAGVTRGLLTGISGKRDPSPVYKNFVNRCLRDKGYEPIGWQ
jgi:hypothetical protein